MEIKKMGTCKHGKFELSEGCPQCVSERLAGELKAKVVEDKPHTTEELSLLAEDMSQCEHGLFIVNMCPDCIKEEQQPETAISLRPGEDVEVRDYYHEGVRLLDYANARVIATLEDNKVANDDLSVISKLKKAMEAKKKDYLSPLKEQMDAIRVTYDSLMGPVLEADRITREKMLAWDNEQRRIRAEQEEINRLRLEAAQKEAALNDGEITESVNLVEVMPEPAKSVSTEMGSSGIAQVKKWEVENLELVPREYLIIDSAKIGKVVRAGIPSIPGIRIWSESSIRNTAR